MDQNKILEGAKVLFLGAHPDDIEFGCGAFIIQHKKLFKDCNFVVLGNREKTTGELYDISVKYQKNAFKKLGLSENKLFCYQLRIRHFPQLGDEIREILNSHNRSFRPDIIFTTSKYDTMQDHVSLSEQTYRVFKNRTIFEYEVIASNKIFVPNSFIKISKSSIVGKVNALHCHEGQRNKPYFSYEVAESLARFRGILSNRYKFAESFYVRSLYL